MHQKVKKCRNISLGINKSLKQPRSRASTPGVHQHIPNLLLLSSFPSWFIRGFFFFVSASVLPLHRSQFPISESHCGCCHCALPSGTARSVTLHLCHVRHSATQCDGASALSRTGRLCPVWSVGVWLWHAELNIDCRSRWGQRSTHSFYFWGHVLQPRDWGTLCVPVLRAVIVLVYRRPKYQYHTKWLYIAVMLAICS